MMNNLKKITKKFLLNTGILRWAGQSRNSGVAILRYHSVSNNPQDLNDIIGYGIVHSSDVFNQQMKILSNYFSPVSMDDVYDFIKHKTKMPSRAVALTFDDGYSDNASIAAPIMDQYGIRGAFYITTGAVDPQPLPWFITLRRIFNCCTDKEFLSPLDGSLYQLKIPQQRREAFLQASRYCALLDLSSQRQWINRLEQLLDMDPFLGNGLMMTKTQIRDLHDAGHIIGSHTISHPNLAHVDESRLQTELADSKFALEKILGLGSSVLHFSYPSPILQPHYNEKTKLFCKDIGYQTGVTCTHGLVYSDDEALICRRISAPQSIEDFKWVLESTFAGFSTK